MKPQHSFTAERALAQHCEQLFAPARDQADKSEQATRFIADLCANLPAHLQPLLAGSKPHFSASEASTQTAASLIREIGRPTASYLVSEAESDTPGTLVSFDHATATSLTDRLFGGDGKTGDDIPATLALSASLALERIVRAIGAAWGLGGQADDVLTIASDSDVARLAPFPRGEYCISWTITAQAEGFDDWQFRIACLESALPGASSPSSRSSGSAPNSTPAARARSAPFDAVPLPLTAILGEVELSLARITNLAPGDVLPLAPRRQVPLQIGPDILARGSVGTLDERVALQITDIS